MFERFTTHARRVLVRAQEEARTSGQASIGTEHLLLGLLDEGDCVAGRVLDSLGISADAVRRQLLAQATSPGRRRVSDVLGLRDAKGDRAWRIGDRESDRPGTAGAPASVPLASGARAVLELALREALRLKHDYVGTEHLLLGLVLERKGVAARVLVGLGADHARVRTQVLRCLSEAAG